MRVTPLPAPLPVFVRLLRWCGHQVWLPRGLRYRLVRRYVDPDRMAPLAFECDFAGLRFAGTLASYIDWSVYFFGAYEPEVLGFLAAAARAAGPGAVFVDIGANVGQHSLFMARRVDRVIAFEPWATARHALEANLARNGLTNVEVRPVGLGDAAADQPFYAPSTTNLGTGSFVPDVNLNEETGCLRVERGDDALAGLDRIDVVKIDTEGYEARVLAGLRNTLARHRPVVLFELTPPVAVALGGADGLESALHALLGQGWRLNCLEAIGEGYALVPFAYTGDGQAIAVALPETSPL